MRVLWSSLTGVLLPGCLLLASCQDGDRAVLEELKRMRSDLRVGGTRTVDPAAVQAIFAPMRQALERLSQRLDADRERQSLLATEVRLLAQQQSGDRGDPAQLQAMQGRLAELEKSWQASKAQAEADKALLIRALKASSSRLEQLLEAVRKTPGGEGKPPAKGQVSENPGEGEKKGGAEPGLLDVMLEPEVLGIFVAVAFFLSLALFLLFPNRLRRPVPQLRFRAQGSSTEETAPLEVPDAEEADPSLGHAPAPHGQNQIDMQASPVRHSLSLRIQSREDLDGLIEILDRYLKTEPYILTEPAPQVALEKDELRLSFFALPTLSQSEHALLDATVRRLRPGHRVREPRQSGAETGSPQAGRSQEGSPAA